MCVFDFSVNVVWEINVYETIVGATADGAIEKLRQVDEWVAMRGEEDLVVAYSDARRRYYRKLIDFRYFWKRLVKTS